MEIKLHANASTTPKTRALIRKSTKSVIELAKEFGVHESTIRKWRKRDNFNDRSHVRHNLGQSTSPEEEEIIVELRQIAGLSIDDITEVMHRCINPKLARSSIYRCLRRKGATKPVRAEEERVSKKFEDTEFGYVHIDLKHLTNLAGKVSYVFVAIERTTRFVYVEVVMKRDGATIAACLERFLKSFPHKVHTILTDNGSEFTDRFAVFKTGKPADKPSGSHPFDLVCNHFNIIHKLTRPFSPQTNGMVERFNRRISEAIGAKEFVVKNQRKNKFFNHDERNKFITDFVFSYNRTRLTCLKYKSPIQLLANQKELYTSARIVKVN